VIVHGHPVHVYEARAGTNAVEKSFVLIHALRELETELNQNDVPPAYADIPHILNLNIGIFTGGNWPSTVVARKNLFKLKSLTF
jgi:acetylornithine deacetylase